MRIVKPLLALAAGAVLAELVDRVLDPAGTEARRALTDRSLQAFLEAATTRH